MEDDADSFLLSVVTPAFNERATIREIYRRMHAVSWPVPVEFVAVDDGSTDGTRALLEQLQAEGRIDRLIFHEENQGKGAALQTAIAAARGEFVVVQDGDLEYNPAEIPDLLGPVLDGRADVVFGSRFTGSGPHRVLFFWHYVANRFLTLVSNMFTNLNLTDMETCYKLFRRSFLEGVRIKERRFGVEPELTACFAAVPGIRIYEVGISYSGRTYEEGKKIHWRDGFVALWCILRYNLWSRKRTATRGVSSVSANPSISAEDRGSSQSAAPNLDRTLDSPTLES